MVSASVLAGSTESDKPAVLATTIGSQPYLFIAGKAIPAGGAKGIIAARSSNGGMTWDNSATFGDTIAQSAELVITKAGNSPNTVYLFYTQSAGSVPLYQVNLKYSFLTPTGSWTTPATVPNNPNSNNGLLFGDRRNGQGYHKRSNSASADDYFFSNSFPKTAANPVSGKLYVVYRDSPSPGSAQVDQGDIYIVEGEPAANGTVNWSATRRVNNDGTATDQWHPSVAISPDGQKLFVGYYSRQDNPSANDLVRVYGATANISSGLAAAAFTVFPLNQNSFPVLFPGSPAVNPASQPWKYDHVWIQLGVKLDKDGRYTTIPADVRVTTTELNQNFCADDYTWVTSDSRYFYFAWCDRNLLSTHTFPVGSGSRPDPNVKLVKIAY